MFLLKLGGNYTGIPAQQRSCKTAARESLQELQGFGVTLKDRINMLEEAALPVTPVNTYSSTVPAPYAREARFYFLLLLSTPLNQPAPL